MFHHATCHFLFFYYFQPIIALKRLFMKYKYFIPFLLILVFASCNSQKAKKYSQDIVKLERSLMPDIEQTETKVAKFANEQNFDSIVVVSVRMEKLFDDKIKEVTSLKMPKVKEAENFKQASLRYFAYLKSIYTSYIKFGSAPTDEARQNELTTLQEIVARKGQAVNDMQSAQKKYADAN